MARYIDAELAEAAMTKLYEEDVEMYAVEIPETFDKDRAISELRKIPAADVEEVKHGEWVEDFMIGEGVYRCTSCDDKFVTLEGTPYDNRLLYCPFCGARMDGKEQTDERTD